LRFPRSTLHLLLCAALVTAFPAGSAAQVAGESRTYFRAWESLDSERHNDLTQYLDIDLGNLGSQGLSFHFGGWGRASLGTESYGEGTNGEFQYGFLNYAHGKDNAVARLGRLYVSEGVALFESLDGLYLGSDLAAGLKFSLYGGIPVETDGEDGRDGDLIYGGRLALGRGPFEVGASYLKEENDGGEFREEAGIDLFFQAGKYLVFDGKSSFNLIESAWADHDYRLTLGTYKGWRLTGSAWQVDYESYFQSPGTTAFGQPLLDAGEQLLLLGGELSYAINPQFTLAATYQSHSYDIAGDAKSYGGLLTWTVPGGGAGLVYRRVDGSTDALRYSEYRGYAYKKLGSWDVTFDALDAVYDEQINGTDDAYALVLALGYDFTPRLRLAGNVEYASNPLFEEEFKGFAKILWSFPAAAGGKGEK
jgi:hypothetical protein